MKVPVILPIKEIDVGLEVNGVAPPPTMIRVFRDHEENTVPMWYVDFITMYDGIAKRALVPIVDIDVPKLGEALLRLQTEYEKMRSSYRTAEEEPARCLPPLVVSRRK